MNTIHYDNDSITYNFHQSLFYNTIYTMYAVYIIYIFSMLMPVISDKKINEPVLFRNSHPLEIFEPSDWFKKTFWRHEKGPPLRWYLFLMKYCYKENRTGFWRFSGIVFWINTAYRMNTQYTSYTPYT
jgi:hypothetical protein